MNKSIFSCNIQTFLITFCNLHRSTIGVWRHTRRDCDSVLHWAFRYSKRLTIRFKGYDWLIDYILLNVLYENIYSLRDVTIANKPMLRTNDLWAGMVFFIVPYLLWPSEERPRLVASYDKSVIPRTYYSNPDSQGIDSMGSKIMLISTHVTEKDVKTIMRQILSLYFYCVQMLQGFKELLKFNVFYFLTENTKYFFQNTSASIDNCKFHVNNRMLKMVFVHVE